MRHLNYVITRTPRHSDELLPLSTFVRIGHPEFRLVVSHFSRSKDTQFVEGWLQLLQHVRPDLFVDLRFDLRDLEYPRGEGVVVDPPARPECGRHYHRVGHEILVDELLKGLADLPAVDVLAVKVGLVAGVELGVRLRLLLAHHAARRREVLSLSGGLRGIPDERGSHETGPRLKRYLDAMIVNVSSNNDAVL